MKKISYFIRNHFGFSKKETNGFFVLLILMGATLLTPPLIDYFYNPQIEIRSDSKNLDSLLASLNYKSEAKTSKRNFNEGKNSLFYFDPNSCEEDELKKIFGKKIASTIIKYRGKGGKFIIKEDLRKVYGIDEKLFYKINNYILLPDSYSKSKVSENKFKISEFDINKADTVELKRIKGIGQKLSERIIKFRDKLGGFISEEQYFEVYGLDTSVVNELKKYSFILPDFIPSKINLKTCSYSQLSAHPYMASKAASIIINYRNQHGGINNSEELKMTKALPQKDFDKIIPYLSFE